VRAARTSVDRWLEDAGWGLRIVSAPADDWGIAENGSRVWGRLRTDGTRRDSPGAAAGPHRRTSGVIARRAVDE
jgi:hypothetical protein